MKTVTAAILEKDGKILIARRRDDDRHAGKWEFPGGTVEPDETPQTCLKREMQEEFGISVTVGRVFGENIYQYDHATIRLIACMVSWESGRMVLNDHADFRWALPEQMLEYDFAPADIPFVRKLQGSKK